MWTTVGMVASRAPTRASGGPSPVTRWTTWIRLRLHSHSMRAVGVRETSVYSPARPFWTSPANRRGPAAPLPELTHLPCRPVIDQPPEGARRPRAVPVLPYLGSLRRQHEWLDVRHLAQRQSHALGGSAKADAVVDEQNPQWF